MSIFSEYILKLLNEYKKVLRRYLTAEMRDKAILELGLKRKSLKFDSDTILYNKAQRVLADIEIWTKKSSYTATEYSGIDEFYNHLKSFLGNYKIENNHIVHMSQKVSRAVVQAIQIISLSPQKISEKSISNKLENCMQLIIKFGTTEQRKMLGKALFKQKNLNDTLILDNFIKMHEDFLACANDSN